MSETKQLTKQDIEQNKDFMLALAETGETIDQYLDRVRNKVHVYRPKVHNDEVVHKKVTGRLEMVKQYIKEHKDWNKKDLCKELNLNPAYFIRLLKQIEGDENGKS